MPRRPTRAATITARVTNRERRAVERLAKQSGVTVSDYLQAVVQQAIENEVRFDGRSTE